MIVSIVIPVFNEEKTVMILLEKVFSADMPKGYSKEVIVINDGSTDLTRPLLLASKYQLKLYSHKRNLGKGAAVRTGIANSTGQLILIQDADLEYNPDDYKRLLAPFRSPEILVVYGSRLIDYPLRITGNNKTPLPVHWLANKFLTLLTNILYGNSVTDMETCYKVLRSDLIRQLNLKAKKFDLEPEITAKILKKGIRIVEIPIRVTPRNYQQGKKIGWKDGVIAISVLFENRFR